MKRIEPPAANTDDIRSTVEKLYRSYSREIFKFVYRLTGDSDETRDIIQETFIKLYHSLDREMEIRDAKSWLYRVAVNTCYTQLRRQTRLQQIVNRELTDGESPGVNGRTPDIEEEYIKQEERQVIRRAFDRLPVRDRIALELYRGELTYQEMAEVLNTRPSSIGKILFRARHRLAGIIRQGEQP